MFVSAGVDLKLHSPSEEGTRTVTALHFPPASKIVNVSFCNDNSYVVLVREAEKPQVYCCKDKDNVRLIHTINIANVTTATFKRNTKKTIAMGTKGGDLIVYDTKARTMVNLPNVSDAIEFLEYTADDHHLCGFDKANFLVFPNTEEVKKYKQAAECSCMRCHAFIPNRVVLGFRNGRVAFWDSQDGVPMLSFDLLEGPAVGVAMSSCGNFLVAAGKSLKVCGIDTKGGNCSFQYQLGVEGTVSSVDVSPDDRFLVAGMTDGTVKLYDVKDDLKLTFSEKSHEVPVNCVIFENQPKQINSNFSSVMRLSERENESVDLGSRPSLAKPLCRRSRNILVPDDSLDRIKKSLVKMVKHEMESLECQLNEHCVKFQKFLDNEFETIDSIISKKWNIFNVGDANQIMKAICPDQSKNE